MPHAVAVERPQRARVSRLAHEAPRAEAAPRERVHRPTIDDFEVSLSAPPVQLKRLDTALVRVRRAVVPGWGDDVQRRAKDPDREEDAGAVHALAARGTQGSGGPLPFLERIQAAFGDHDVRAISAHTGGDASAACEGMGAIAYASGERVAFREAPTLHTAAHEAAHVVQQRAGVALAGGVGQIGDAYERHADAVADAVVRGDSAEGLLDSMAGRGRAAGRGVQQAVQRETEEEPGVEEADDDGKDEAPADDDAKDQAPADDAKDQAPADDAAKDEAPADDAAKDEAPADDAAKGATFTVGVKKDFQKELKATKLNARLISSSKMEVQVDGAWKAVDGDIGPKLDFAIWEASNDYLKPIAKVVAGARRAYATAKKDGDDAEKKQLGKVLRSKNEHWHEKLRKEWTFNQNWFAPPGGVPIAPIASAQLGVGVDGTGCVGVVLPAVSDIEEALLALLDGASSADGKVTTGFDVKAGFFGSLGGSVMLDAGLGMPPTFGLRGELRLGLDGDASAKLGVKIGVDLAKNEPVLEVSGEVGPEVVVGASGSIKVFAKVPGLKEWTEPLVSGPKIEVLKWSPRWKIQWDNSAGLTFTSLRDLEKSATVIEFWKAGGDDSGIAAQLINWLNADDNAAATVKELDKQGVLGEVEPQIRAQLLDAIKDDATTDVDDHEQRIVDVMASASGVDRTVLILEAWATNREGRDVGCPYAQWPDKIAAWLGDSLDGPEETKGLALAATAMSHLDTLMFRAADQDNIPAYAELQELARGVKERGDFEEKGYIHNRMIELQADGMLLPVWRRNIATAEALVRRKDDPASQKAGSDFLEYVNTRCDPLGKETESDTNVKLEKLVGRHFDHDFTDAEREELWRLIYMELEQPHYVFTADGEWLGNPDRDKAEHQLKTYLQEIFAG